MRKILFYACCVLFAQTVTASTGVPFHPAPLKYAKAPLRFRSYGRYLEYSRKKLFEGLDSANAFYKNEFKKSVETYTDYLPLTAGSGSPLTGTLYSTGGFRLTLDGSNSLYAGYYQQSVTGTTYAINMQMGATGELQLWNYNGSWNKAFQIDNSGNTILYGNVGIGTTSPFTKLSVGDYVGIGTTNDASGDMASKDGLVFQTSEGTYRGAAIVGKQYGSYGVDLLFGTKESGGNELKERMRITNGGYVGIGTTSPGMKLEVYGTPTSGVTTNAFLTNRNSTPSVWAGTTLGFGYQADLENYSSRIIGYSNAYNTYSTRLQLQTHSSTSGVWNAGVLLDESGNVGVGTTSPSEKLSVNGNVRAKKMIVTQTGWSDYVFNKDYKLRTLQQVESFIKKNNHLPEIPSAKEVEEKGISVGDNQALLLKKIEELTLYLIQQQKEINALKKQIKK